MLAALAEVQAARQIAADAALADARAAEAAAVEAERSAQRDLEAAERAWRDLLARPCFAPELAGGMAHVLVSREAEAGIAADALRAAGDDHLAGQQAWRIAETQKRTAARDLRNARRAAARHREDKRSDALADRVTYDWMRA